MYIYSIVALALACYLGPHIRKQSPLQCLALAYFYAIDTIINAAYTAAFSVAWFLVVAAHDSENDNAAKGPGGDMIDDASGFTSPEHNVSRVEVVASPVSGLGAGQEAVAVGASGLSSAPAGLGNAIFQSGSIASLTIICLLWAVRVYFLFIVMAYARQVLRQHIVMTSASGAGYPSGGSSDLAENPFSEDKEAGQGWRGKLGRAMLKVGSRYWLGSEEEEFQQQAWVRNMGGKFRKSIEPVGVGERERRRRSGTGPPAPPPMPAFVENVEQR